VTLSDSDDENEVVLKGVGRESIAPPPVTIDAVPVMGPGDEEEEMVFETYTPRAVEVMHEQQFRQTEPVMNGNGLLSLLSDNYSPFCFRSCHPASLDRTLRPR
jgi:hypothetical protein